MDSESDDSSSEESSKGKNRERVMIWTMYTPTALFFQCQVQLDRPSTAVEWNGMEWNGMEWNGMEVFGMVLRREEEKESMNRLGLGHE